MKTLGTEFLKTEINKRIENIQHKRNRYKRNTLFFFICSTTFTGISSILLGLKLENAWNERSRIICLILSTLTTIITAFNTFFGNKELWLSNNEALNKLYQLIFDIEFEESRGNPLSPDLLEDYKKRYQDILNEGNRNWQKNRGSLKK